MKLGKKAELEFKRHIESLGKRAYLYRITDTSDVMTRIKGTLPSVPSEFVLVLDGKTSFVEIKTSTNKTKFPKANLRRKSQKAAGKQVVAAGGTYTYYIFSSVRNQWYMMEYEESVKRKKWDWNLLTKCDLRLL